MGNKLLEVKNLKTTFFTVNGEIKAVDGISYYVDEGEVVALVGESGCGKSVSQLSVMQLVQSPPGKIVGGEIVFQGQDLLQCGAQSKEMREIRGARIGMIFQEPMTSLDPVQTVGSQLAEVIRRHKKVSKKQAWEIGVKTLEAVSIPDARVRMKNYPFELSGGMRQRIMIAITLACQSQLIITDEPTTALDVTIQAQIMELLMRLVRENKTSLVVVTHNLGLVTRHADRIYVMYAGKIVESGVTEDIITKPRHPYTIGLLNSVPKLRRDCSEDLNPIEGAPPDLANLPNECYFLPRCPYGKQACKGKKYPDLRQVDGQEHFIACFMDIGNDEGCTI
ncbi:oligopeptide transport system ATP-binding protein [Sporobacter termitidis DSM 10068]|uniref:Oligopeptide transport system ATP-binding protein n=1 Tax=Sporobacter termitidis DSM 10068 TaxID=1123282 RepID=A0A1M5YQW9_9FIRM|nr:ABC transporter ATP-binding protein [Sporobacter termitidis]SHI14507.1 oligopeptide transport system ATP-binding protein [Sporobacter termitidis DSM 10068]